MGFNIGLQWRRRTQLFFLFALVFSFVSTSHAAFQENLWGARPAALSGAFTALADDANSPAYNPAGISLLTQSELTFMYARLYNGVNFYSGNDTSRLGLGYFSYVPDIKDKKYGSYAISWTNFVATNLYREDTFSLTFADSYQFDSIRSGPVLSYGTNLKFLRRGFSQDDRTSVDPVFSVGADSNAVTFDLGFLVQPNFSSLPGLKIGLAGQNLTEPNIGLATTDRVPSKIALGVAYQDPAMPLVNPSVEISRRDGRNVVSGAFESLIAKNTLALRMGGNEDQIGAGVGYKFSLFRSLDLRLDYALIWPFKVEGTNGTHRISITSSF
jgi:hypothetical protein